ncbi:MAG: hypothetical protein U0Z44_13335 [Kouleothrix sp.]
MRYASWSVIVDDIVFPDGRTAMGVLGGGGSYTAAGMRVWSHEVSVLGNVGADFDPVLLGRLDLQAIDLRSTHRPTPRAWQLFEDDGQRTQIPRIPLGDWSAQVGWPGRPARAPAGAGRRRGTPVFSQRRCRRSRDDRADRRERHTRRSRAGY